MVVGVHQGWWRGPLADVSSPSAAKAAQASEAVAESAGVDGNSLGTEFVAHGSRCGGSDGGALGVGGEDGSWQGDNHGGRLDEDTRVLALQGTGLVAAVGQRGGSAGAAGVVAGHVCGVEEPWKGREAVEQAQGCGGARSGVAGGRGSGEAGVGLWGAWRWGGVRAAEAGGRACWKRGARRGRRRRGIGLRLTLLSAEGGEGVRRSV